MALTEQEINEKVDKINEIMESKELYYLDDYFTEMYMAKDHKFLFRVKHKRFYDSQQEANEVLEEILSNLVKLDPEPLNPTKTG